MDQIVNGKYPTNYHNVTIMLKDGTEVSGKLNIGEYQRVSDLFRQLNLKYIIITEAKHRGASGKVLIVNVSEIIWCEPD